MENFICTNCRYRFKSSKDPRDCPYCGKDKGIEREKSASDILDEVEGMLQ